MRRRAVFVICFLFLSASFARAEFYHWVDREGKEFYTNDREQVPREYRNNVAAVNPDESRVSVGEKSVSTKRPSDSLKDHKDKNGKGEEFWRKRAMKLRKELALLQAEYDLILKKEREEDNKPKTLSARNSSKQKKSRVGIDKKKSALEKDLARKKHELEVELPDEARKADAYPGWIRE
jgi:hypothetical protein